ncbi:ent-kaurenoic acid monooxygenase [Ranunculus cassubicifolius]
MGLPFLGEMLSFLWYFKILRRPDDFIRSKQKRYGEGVGLYRTYLFGAPSIIGCSPEFNKCVFQANDRFPLKWPAVELVGYNSLVAVEGIPHTSIRSFVSNAINKPDALRKITKMVQPQIVSSLRAWADKGSVIALHEIKKITFGNIGNFFVSFKPGPMLDMIDELFAGLVKGIRAQPSSIPGTAYHRAAQCRKQLMAIFREELET